MIAFQTCSRCGGEIGLERVRHTPIVCDHCGFVSTQTEKAVQAGLERTLVHSAIFFSISLVLLVGHIMSWGRYSLEVPVIQLTRVTGLASTSTYQRLSEICMDLGKYDCVESNYLHLALTDNDYYKQLGELQMRRSEFKDATDSFRRYLAAGGKDIEAHYYYARALSEIGRIDEAAKYYDYVLAAKPDVVQTTVIENYVHMLIKKNRLTQARRVIQKVRTQGAVASQFMEKEFRELERLHGKRG